MKINKKILISFLIIFILFNVILCVNSQASSFFNTMRGIMNNTTLGITTSSAQTTAITVINTIFRVIQVGAIGFVIIKFSWVGIKYFSRSTSPTEKAYKKGELVRTLIMGVVVFGAVGFFEIIYDAFNGSSSSGGSNP